MEVSLQSHLHGWLVYTCILTLRKTLHFHYLQWECSHLEIHFRIMAPPFHLSWAPLNPIVVLGSVSVSTKSASWLMQGLRMGSLYRLSQRNTRKSDPQVSANSKCKFSWDFPSVLHRHWVYSWFCFAESLDDSTGFHILCLGILISPSFIQDRFSGNFCFFFANSIILGAILESKGNRKLVSISTLKPLKVPITFLQ